MRNALIATAWATVTGVFAYAQVIPSLKVLYQFNRGANSVTAPDTTLVEVKPGIFVGSYSEGVFSITSTGDFNVVSNFQDTQYAGTVSGPVTPASNGLYYGEAFDGNLDFGIYLLGSSGGRVFIDKDLQALSPLVEGSDGYLWGTQCAAPANCSVFKISLDGSLTTVSTYTGSLAAGPLFQASDGNFYGATASSLDSASGQIFRLTPSGESRFCTLSQLAREPRAG